MGFNVVITGVQAVITPSENGRYPTSLDAVMATLKAAHDINLTEVLFESMAVSLIDNFTGGLRQNSAVVYDLFGISIKEKGLLSRFKTWLIEWFSTYRAEQKHLELEGYEIQDPKRVIGGTLSLRLSNRFHPIRLGKHV